MTEFEAEANLSISVDERELRQARQQIQDGIGETPVGMTDGGTPSAQAAGGGGGRARRRARRGFRMEIERTDYLEELVEIADDIEDNVGGEGAGGLFGAIGDAAGGLGGALPQAIASGVGSAVGTAVGDVVSDETIAVEGETLDVETDEFAVDVQAEELDALEIAVEAPEVDDIGVDVDTEELDEFAVDVQTDTLEEMEIDVHVGEDLENFEVGVDASEVHDLELDVADPSPLSVEEPSPVDVNVHVADAASEAGEGPSGPFERAGQLGGHFPIAGHAAGFGIGLAEETIPAAESSVRDFMGWNGGVDHDLESDEWSTTPTDNQPRLADIDTARSGSSSGDEPSVTVDANQDYTINLGDVTVDADVRSLRDDIMDDVERMVDDAIDELEREIARSR